MLSMLSVSPCSVESSEIDLSEFQEDNRDNTEGADEGNGNAAESVPRNAGATINPV